MWCSVSAAHSTYPCGGQPNRVRDVQISSVVSRSKNFSSSSQMTDRCCVGYWWESSMADRWMRVRSSTV